MLKKFKITMDLIRKSNPQVMGVIEDFLKYLPPDTAKNIANKIDYNFISKKCEFMIKQKDDKTKLLINLKPKGDFEGKYLLMVLHKITKEDLQDLNDADKDSELKSAVVLKQFLSSKDAFYKFLSDSQRNNAYKDNYINKDVENGMRDFCDKYLSKQVASVEISDGYKMIEYNFKLENKDHELFVTCDKTVNCDPEKLTEHFKKQTNSSTSAKVEYDTVVGKFIIF